MPSSNQPEGRDDYPGLPGSPSPKQLPGGQSKPADTVDEDVIDGEFETINPRKKTKKHISSSDGSTTQFLLFVIVILLALLVFVAWQLTEQNNRVASLQMTMQPVSNATRAPTATPTLTFTPSATPTATFTPSVTPTLPVRAGACLGFINADEATLWNEPSTASDRIDTIFRHQPVEVLQRTVDEDWYEVATRNRETGWVQGFLLRFDNAICTQSLRYY